HGSGIGSGARHYIEAVGASLFERKIQRDSFIGVQTVLLDYPHHSHNAVIGSLWSVIGTDSLAYRILMGPETLHRLFIHHDHGLAFLRVAVGEYASLHQGDFHHLEIVG